jgi:septum formation protein
VGAESREPRAKGQNPEIILASASPRRATLLTQIGLPFRVCPSTLGEDGEAAHDHETSETCAARLALAKASDVAARLDQGLIIGADTVVTCRGRILGKPRNGRRPRLCCPGQTHRGQGWRS